MKDLVGGDMASSSFSVSAILEVREGRQVGVFTEVVFRLHSGKIVEIVGTFGIIGGNRNGWEYRIKCKTLKRMKIEVERARIMPKHPIL